MNNHESLQPPATDETSFRVCHPFLDGQTVDLSPDRTRLVDDSTSAIAGIYIIHNQAEKSFAYEASSGRSLLAAEVNPPPLEQFMSQIEPDFSDHFNRWLIDKGEDYGLAGRPNPQLTDYALELFKETVVRESSYFTTACDLMISPKIVSQILSSRALPELPAGFAFANKAISCAQQAVNQFICQQFKRNGHMIEPSPLQDYLALRMQQMKLADTGSPAIPDYLLPHLKLTETRQSTAASRLIDFLSTIGLIQQDLAELPDDMEPPASYRLSANLFYQMLINKQFPLRHDGFSDQARPDYLKNY